MVVALGAAGSAQASAASVSWIATEWSIQLLYQADPATAGHFFGTPSSYATSPQPAGFPHSFAAAPALWFASYAQFAADIKAGTITYPYHWLYYDPEHWSQTPVAEQQDPRKYLRLFATLAHTHGYQVIEAPARDLGQVTGSACPEKPGETLNDWYVRCDVAGMVARYSDIFELEDQANTVNVSEYDWLFKKAQHQALAVNPNIVIVSGLSAHIGTPAQMAAAAESVNPAGFYVTIQTSQVQVADQFFTLMQQAGY